MFMFGSIVFTRKAATAVLMRVFDPCNCRGFTLPKPACYFLFSCSHIFTCLLRFVLSFIIIPHNINFILAINSLFLKIMYGVLYGPWLNIPMITFDYSCIIPESPGKFLIRTHSIICYPSL